DGPVPGAQGRFPAEITQPAEGLDEGLLDAVTGLVRVPHQAVNHSVDAVYVRVVQHALGGGVSVQHPGDQLSVVHQPPEAFKVPPARATLTREPGSGLRGCLFWNAKARSHEGAEGLERGSVPATGRRLVTVVWGRRDRLRSGVRNCGAPTKATSPIPPEATSPA